MPIVYNFLNFKEILVTSEKNIENWYEAIEYLKSCSGDLLICKVWFHCNVWCQDPRRGSSVMILLTGITQLPKDLWAAKSSTSNIYKYLMSIVVVG